MNEHKSLSAGSGRAPADAGIPAQSPKARGDNAYRRPRTKGWRAPEPRRSTSARDILQRVYDDVITKAFPDRFKDLLSELDQRGDKASGGAGQAAAQQQVEGNDDPEPDRMFAARPLTTSDLTHDDATHRCDAMLAAVPSLRAFAISLCGNVDRADDLVQETLLRAMANIDLFQPGTNMSAWPSLFSESLPV